MDVIEIVLSSTLGLHRSEYVSYVGRRMTVSPGTLRMIS
jgi:hypothetical protein